VLSVSASDHNDRLYAFSNSGARVAAPGENSTTGLGGTYDSFLGTSAAAPVVSGIAALAFSLVPSATPGQVEQAIEASAVPIPGVASGRVDAYAALRTLAPAPAPASTPVAPGQAHRGREERDNCRHDEDEGRHRQAQARKERERRPRDRCRPAAGDGEGPQRPRGDQAQAAGGRTRRSLRPRRRRRESARTGARAHVPTGRQHDQPQACGVCADDQLSGGGLLDDRKFFAAPTPYLSTLQR
jgi:hypothetical protein